MPCRPCARAAALLWLCTGAAAHANPPPQLLRVDGHTELRVQGKPLLLFGGELANSSAGTAAAAARVLPALARRGFNTILMPVPWRQIEPRPGHFDFAVLDQWIARARAQHLHLVLLWFGSWKNALSSYAPTWVLTDPHRYRRARSVSGAPLPMLSVFGRATRRADAQAFARLLHHLRRIDARQQTVVMVQIENEVGYLGLGGRDRSSRAERLFARPVPSRLIRALRAAHCRLPWRLKHAVHLTGRTWTEVFGPLADQAFMAWYYARYVQAVARAGRARYALPVYMNAQLPAPHERAGHYPSGGPDPLMQPIYRAGAPAIDFYAPDIYWPDFEHWVRRYRRAGNPLFVPESRRSLAAFDALYVFGQARGFGFSAFAVDQPLPQSDRPQRSLAAVYAALRHLAPALLRAQRADRTRALILHLDSPRPEQTLALGGYWFRARLARDRKSGRPLTHTGAMLLIERRAGDFDLLGMGLTVTVLRDPDVDTGIAGIAQVDRLAWHAGRWRVVQRLNGDQTNQGRQILLSAHHVGVYRVRLYSMARR